MKWHNDEDSVLPTSHPTQMEMTPRRHTVFAYHCLVLIDPDHTAKEVDAQRNNKAAGRNGITKYRALNKDTTIFRREREGKA